MANEDLLGNVIGSFAKLFANIWQFFLSNDFAHLEASNGVNGDLMNIYILHFSPTAECFGVFSHSKGFGADRSSSKTDSPKVPRFQVKVPK